MIDKVYNLWNRNPVTVRASYLSSSGAKDRPPVATLTSY
jgi:3',5'-cyclic-AMP phosphodiesterase